MDTERQNPNGLNSKSYDTFQRDDHTKRGTQTNLALVYLIT